MQKTLDGRAASRLKPPLKWAGGKRWLVSRLLRMYRPHRARRLVEPFCGGLSVSLGLRPHKALLNDVNPHLINFYRHLQKGFIFKIDVVDDPNHYYNFRDEFNELVTGNKAHTRRAAELFYYLNRTCYNGLCRFNQSGEFNTPYGKYKQPYYQTHFKEYREAFEAWEFSTGDFRLLDLKKRDFIYADPPYDVPFTQYSKGGFDFDDQTDLAEHLKDHDGPVVLSNQATPRILELYQSCGFEVELVPAPRMISCNGNRDRATEVIATKGV